MAIATLLWIASLTTSGSPEAKEVGDVPLRAHVLEMEGFQWRADLLDGLQYVGQEGGSTIWTADAATLRRLVAAAKGCRPVGTPKGRSAGRSRIGYVASLQRIAQVSGGKVTALAFKPSVGNVPDGIEIEATGRREVGGVLANLAIKDSHIITIHTAIRSEQVYSASGSARLNATFQVPEVSEKRPAGRWLIPEGGVVVVGLGVATVQDSDRGRAIQRERVVVVDAGDVPPSTFIPPARTPTPAWKRHLERTAGPVALASSIGAGFLAGWFVRGRGDRGRGRASIAPAGPSPVADADEVAEGAAGMHLSGRPMEVDRQSPTVAQLMVLVGASAVACWAVQAATVAKSPLDLWREVVAAIAEGKPFGEAIAATGALLMFVVAPMLAAWSATLALIALRLPRASWPRLRDRPGVMAGFQVVLVVAAVTAAGPLLSFSFGPESLVQVAVGLVAVFSGLTVFACWVTMAFLRTWRHEPTWVDRLGLLLGSAWIVTLPFTLTALGR